MFGWLFGYRSRNEPPQKFIPPPPEYREPKKYYAIVENGFIIWEIDPNYINTGVDEGWLIWDRTIRTHKGDMTIIYRLISR